MHAGGGGDRRQLVALGLEAGYSFVNVVHLKVEDGKTGRLVVGLGIDKDGIVAGNGVGCGFDPV